MQFFLMVIGITTCSLIILYAIAALASHIDDDSNFRFLMYPLVIVGFVCFICSLPLQCFMKIHNDKKEKEYKRKSYDSDKKYRETINSILDGKEIKIKQLTTENTVLKDQLLDEYYRGREEGELAGERSGFRIGYREGFDSCFRQANLDQNDYSKMFRYTYLYDCKCFEREQLKRQEELDSQD